MGDVMVDGLVDERSGLLGKIEALKLAATETGRDLSDDDLTSISTAKDRIAKIDARLEVIGDDLALPSHIANAIAKVTSKVPTTPAAYRTAGEALYDLLHQGEEDSQARYRTALKRAAEHMGIDAATTVPVAGDLGGLYVDPVVGPVIRPHPQGTPFASAIGLRPMPGSFSFERPFILDPDWEDGMGQQGEGATLGFEKAELPSRAFTADSDTLKAKTIGGYLNVSQQLISLQPGSLDLIVEQLRWRRDRAIEAFVVDEMNNTTGHVPLAADADGATVLAALFDASVAVYNATGAPATWVAMGPLGWARLGSLVDAAGRPLFPWLAPGNAMGQASASTFTMSGPAGLTPIVTPGITTADFYVGNDLGIEAYLYLYPLLEAVEPSVLGRQIAVAASIVAHRPTPYANSVQRVGV